MPAEDLFGGDSFDVPDSVARALASMNGTAEPVPIHYDLLAASAERAAVPAGVWVTCEVDDTSHQYISFTSVKVHASELDALREAVGKTGYTAAFLPYETRLEDVVDE